jgi:hypothetical protein
MSLKHPRPQRRLHTYNRRRMTLSTLRAGHLVADFIARNLSIVLGEYLSKYPLSKALLDAFMKVDEGLKDSAIDCSFSGAATTVSVLKGSVLTTAWVGDSRGVLGRRVNGAVQAFDLTQDHKPSQPEEEARIKAAGGRVERLQVRPSNLLSSELDLKCPEWRCVACGGVRAQGRAFAWLEGHQMAEGGG